jgi:hypothetical protein
MAISVYTLAMCNNTGRSDGIWVEARRRSAASLHYQGPVLATRVGTRLQDTLDLHFRQNGPAYFTQELHHIDVKPVTHDPEFVVDYCMKALKSRCLPDDIVVFPRTVSELAKYRTGSGWRGEANV